MTPVFAYIDPSSGVITIQILVASLAGVVIYCRAMLSKAVRKLTRKDKGD